MSSLLTLFALPAVVVLLLAMPLIPVCRGMVTGKRAKTSILCNLGGFFGVCLVAVLLPAADLQAFAAAEAAESILSAISVGQGMGYLAAALVTGMSTIGAGIAVAAAAPAAIGAASEDPKSFGKSMIFVALGEGVALYGLLVSILIINSL